MAIRLCSNCKLNGTVACPYSTKDPRPMLGCSEHEFILLSSNGKGVAENG